MFLVLTSPNQTTLIQLATGFGKSLMLALMAQWINTFQNKKVIIVVPSAFLHAYQQFFYCPSASEIPDDITDPTCK
jgi:superfamily II DNA or RNA helicase